MGDEGLPLSQALSSLRAELRQAIEAARDVDLRFKVTEIEVQLQVVATDSEGVNTGLGLWQVLKVGGKFDHSASTHTVKLTLTPDPASGDLHVRGGIVKRPR